MTYEVLRGFTANGRAYRPGERVEGAELKHEAQMATRRHIKLVSQAEAGSSHVVVEEAVKAVRQDARTGDLHNVIADSQRQRGRS